jgi:hypothetical protein
MAGIQVWGKAQDIYMSRHVVGGDKKLSLATIFRVHRIRKGVGGAIGQTGGVESTILCVAEQLKHRGERLLLAPKNSSPWLISQARKECELLPTHQLTPMVAPISTRTSRIEDDLAYSRTLLCDCSSFCTAEHFRRYGSACKIVSKASWNGVSGKGERVCKVPTIWRSAGAYHVVPSLEPLFVSRARFGLRVGQSRVWV